MKIFRHRSLPALALAVAAGAAHAQVVLHQKSAEAGSSFKAAFVVSHGCGTSPTSAIIVKLPADIVNAKAMAKAGWLITTSKAQGRVSEIAWRGGKLDPELYDEFTIVLRVPDSPGKRYFAVRQECEEGATDWSVVPAEGKSSRDYKTPAVELEVVPATTASASSHKH